MALKIKTLNSQSTDFPHVSLSDIDTLWLQVAGNLCNLQCKNCFISCSPTNHSLEMLSIEKIESILVEADQLGVKEYYITGGEPFLHPKIFEFIERTLCQGPVTVLTNGTLIKPAAARKLREISNDSDYSLDIRVSLDGYDAKTNDSIRGEGTFKKILKAIQYLNQTGINPVITVTEACEGVGTQDGRKNFLEFLRTLGLNQPRLKILPLLKIGEEVNRSRAYESWETLKGRHLTDEEAEKLQCSSCRMVTSNGVYVCPILIDFPDAKMGNTLKETCYPFKLRHQACFTCYEKGLSCRT